MILRRSLAFFTFATAIVLPAASFADTGSEPAEAPAADDAERPHRENVRGVKLVELPVHAADRARERVAFAHERRDLHKLGQAAKREAEQSDTAHGERPEKGEKHRAVTVDRRAAAAALRESATERRGHAKERRETAKEKRAQAADHLAQIEERKAAAAEKRAQAEDNKAKGEEKRGEHKK